MLMLLFYVGSNIYALDCKSIIEVVPRVNLKKIAHLPDYMAGLLDFRGVSVPIVDMCQLIEGRPSASRLHTRIIILNYVNSTGLNHYLGMIAEKVIEIIDRENSDFVETNFKAKDLPFLGGVFHSEEATIQLFQGEEFFNHMRSVL